MKPSNFEYYRPGTLDEAMELVSSGEPGAMRRECVYSVRESDQ